MRCKKCFGVGYLNLEKLNLPISINIFDTDKVRQWILDTNNTEMIICDNCQGTGKVK